MIIHLYKRPNGRHEIIDIPNVYPEDAEYFERNNFKISMEEVIGGQYACYACPEDDLTEESELLVLSAGKNCKDTLRELAEYCKKEFKNAT